MEFLELMHMVCYPLNLCNLLCTAIDSKNFKSHILKVTESRQKLSKLYLIEDAEHGCANIFLIL